MVESVDTGDLKSPALIRRVGSSPTPGTHNKNPLTKGVFTSDRNMSTIDSFVYSEAVVMVMVFVVELSPAYAISLMSYVVSGERFLRVCDRDCVLRTCLPFT